MTKKSSPIVNQSRAVYAGLAAGTLAFVLIGCSNDNADSESPLSPEARLGELIFNDVSLSASGRQSCASCHDEAHAHTPANDLPAQFGGADLTLQGGRSAPSLRYLDTNTAFHFDEEGTPTGGFFWDGRAASLQAQAGGPFLNPVEMANKTVSEVVGRLAQASYASAFKAAFGENILNNPESAFERMTWALQKYQLEDKSFRPFNSKYDEYLRDKAVLNPQESRGLQLFKDQAKGNCAACHPAEKGADGSHPLFTDFTYDNLGVPRNPALAQNKDPAFFDLGLCEQAGGRLADRTDLCGAFKVPSLRNVAQRKVLFHNGHFKSLKDAVTFYVQRDTHPERWYPLNTDGTVRKFDDLPSQYHANVNTTEAPYDRKPGDAPALTDAEIDDLIAFLRTLDDGYASR